MSIPPVTEDKTPTHAVLQFFRQYILQKKWLHCLITLNQAPWLLACGLSPVTVLQKLNG